MTKEQYHRITTADPDEQMKVEKEGYLRGRRKRQCMGNAEASVKAYLGPLPAGEPGYSFETLIAPSKKRNFFMGPGAEWCEGDPGVEDVPGDRDYVRIPVKVLP